MEGSRSAASSHQIVQDQQRPTLQREGNRRGRPLSQSARQRGCPFERRTHDYKRHGTASLYAAFNIATGDVLGRITEQHRAKEFLDFLKQIDRAHAQSVELHLILDKSGAHKTPDVNRWLEAHPRFKLHFTPTSASWLNAVEIRRYIDAHNLATAKPFVWTKSAESILAAVDRAKRAMGTTQMGH